MERSAPEPMIALDLWGSRLLASANGSLLCGMMALAGVTSYLPMYFQGVLGYSAIYAGFPLMVMMVTWPMASAISGTILRYLSMRATLRLGSFLIPIGAVFLLFLKPGTTLIVAGIGPALMGFGMGLLNITSVIMVQGTIEWSKRASATAALIFSRTLGNTLGVAALGAVLNFGIVLFAAAQGRERTDDARSCPRIAGDDRGRGRRRGRSKPSARARRGAASRVLGDAGVRGDHSASFADDPHARTGNADDERARTREGAGGIEKALPSRRRTGPFDETQSFAG